MSDFLTNLVARQLGNAPEVRPRLLGRFEPPPDAFDEDPAPRVPSLTEPEEVPREFFFEVDAPAATARGSEPERDSSQTSRAHGRLHEARETSASDLLVERPRERAEPARAHSREPLTRTDSSRDDSPRPAPSTGARSEAGEPRTDPHDDAPARRSDERRDHEHGRAPVDDSQTRKQPRAADDDEAVRPGNITRTRAEDSARDASEGSPDVRARDERAREDARRPDTSAPFARPAPTQRRMHSDGETRTRAERRTPPPQTTRRASSSTDDDAPRRDAEAPRTAATTEARDVTHNSSRRDSDAPRRPLRVEPTLARESLRERNQAPAPPRSREGDGDERAAQRAPLVVPRTPPHSVPSPSLRARQRAASREALNAAAQPAPTINVTIGRVEVRATQAPAAPSSRNGGETATPRMTLEDYLRRRSGEVRE